MGKTTAQKGARVVKDGIRHKDVYATAVGDTTKAYCLFLCFELNCFEIPLVMPVEGNMYCLEGPAHPKPDL